MVHEGWSVGGSSDDPTGLINPEVRSKSMAESGSSSMVGELGIHHVTVQARDLEASLKLYRDVLGMKVVA